MYHHCDIKFMKQPCLYHRNLSHANLFCRCTKHNHASAYLGNNLRYCYCSTNGCNPGDIMSATVAYFRKRIHLHKKADCRSSASKACPECSFDASNTFIYLKTKLSKNGYTGSRCLKLLQACFRIMIKITA